MDHFLMIVACIICDGNLMLIIQATRKRVSFIVLAADDAVAKISLRCSVLASVGRDCTLGIESPGMSWKLAKTSARNSTSLLLLPSILEWTNYSSRSFTCNFIGSEIYRNLDKNNLFRKAETAQFTRHQTSNAQVTRHRTSSATS